MTRDLKILGTARACKTFWKKALQCWPGARLIDHQGKPLDKVPARYDWTSLKVETVRGPMRLEPCYDSMGHVVGRIAPASAVPGAGNPTDACVWLELPSANARPMHPRDWALFACAALGVPVVVVCLPAQAEMLEHRLGLPCVEGPPSLGTRNAADWHQALLRLWDAVATLPQPSPPPGPLEFSAARARALLFNRSSAAVDCGREFLAHPDQGAVVALERGRSLEAHECGWAEVSLSGGGTHRRGEHFRLGEGFGYLIAPAP